MPKVEQLSIELFGTRPGHYKGVCVGSRSFFYKGRPSRAVVGNKHEVCARRAEARRFSALH